jgi:hypothetical protein
VSIPINTIAIFPKIQPDTVAAVFLLKKYGAARFPGIAEAEVVFWSATPPGKTAEDFEREGILLIDLAGSRFDHHRDDHGRKTECASSLVARYLGVDKKPELRKLLTYAKRDDLEGKGTISTDPLDRAFGLSGIIMNLNRVHGDDPRSVLDFVLAIYDAHVHDEWRRAVEMPAEWKAIKASGRAFESSVPSPDGALRVIALESDNVGLPGFLRAYLKADVVIQRLSSGHVNIITRQNRRLDLKKTVGLIRLEEARIKGLPVESFDETRLQKPGRVDGIDEWFYDTAANTVQNGGVKPQGIPATRLGLEAVAKLVQAGLRAETRALTH